MRMSFGGLRKAAVWLAWLLAARAGAQPQQGGVRSGHESVTFSVRSQMVQVFVTVTEGSRMVTGLGPPDFELTEDGVPLEISRLDASEVPLNIALLLDTSESMRDALRDTQEAAVYFVESLKPSDRVTLIPFSSDIRSVLQTTDDTAPVLEAIRDTKASGQTELYEAILTGMKSLADKEGRKALVVFSDGEDTAMARPLGVVLNAVARYGYPVYCIGAGDALKNGDLRRILRQLTEVNSGRLYLVEHPVELRTAFSEISAELRSAYVLNYYTGAPPDGRWHDLAIRLTNQNYKARHRRGFYARTSGARDWALSPRNVQRRMEDRPAALEPPLPPVEEPAALQALQEITKPPPAELRADVEPVLSALRRAAPSRQEVPVFRVEARLVEVPVLVEAPAAGGGPALARRDFRIYEDDAVMDVAFFSEGVQGRSLDELRSLAVREVRATGQAPLQTMIWQESQVLARYYLVLDDLTSEAGDLLSAKEAAKRIVRENHHPLRPFSLHFASQSQAGVLAEEGIEKMVQRIDAAMPRGSSDLTNDRGFMTVHEAYLIERGDKTAFQLAALRYASDSHYSYSNELGSVTGLEGIAAGVIENAVQMEMMRMIGENSGYVSRSLTGLEAVVGAAAADPGEYPKTVIFVSSGFVPGRQSGRSGLPLLMDHIIAQARRNGIRIFTVDAAGMKPLSAVAVESRAHLVLVQNPNLESLFLDHASGWQMEKESSLNQLAAETGGAFLHLSNDIAGLMQGAVRSTGQLYYLGYLSRQPPDGRFHRIRVTVSLPSARVRSRRGFFARDRNAPETLAEVSPDGEDWATVMARVVESGKTGDMRGVAAGLEMLVRRFPNQLEFWYNLGIAHLHLGNSRRAVEVLQRASSLAPRNREIGVLLARSQAAARYRRAAVETLRLMTREYPEDIDLLLELGRACEADSRPEEAFLAYRAALDLTSAPEAAHYLLLIRTAVPLQRQAEARLYLDRYLAAGGSAEEAGRWRPALSPRMR